MVMHSLRMLSRLTWYFCWTRSRRFCAAMFFCASSTSRAPRRSCNSVKRRALLAQPSSRAAHPRLLRLLLRHQLGGLGVDLLAVVLQLLDQAARFLDLRLGLLLAAHEGGKLAAPLLDDLGQLAHALFEGLPLLLEGRAHLLLRRQRHAAFGQAAVGRVAAPAAESPATQSTP